MCFASASCLPAAPDLATLSDPARSTRLSFECTTMSEPGVRADIANVKIECDRDDARFMDVLATVRLVLPTNSRFVATSAFVAECEVRLCTTACDPESVTETLGSRALPPDAAF